MAADEPLVAICMATHEPEPALLERQLDSIRAQTHASWVCLISDDGSEGRRLERLRELTAGDARFVLSRSASRLGFYLNFERALTMVPAEAEFIALADQDDRWYPEKLAALLAARGDAELVYSDMRIVEEAGGVLSETFWRGRRNNHTDLAWLLLANTVTGAASLFRRQLLERALPFPAPVGAPFHDQWIAAVALASGDLAYLDRPLYDYVQHDAADAGHELAMGRWQPGRRLRWRRPRASLAAIAAHGERFYAADLRRIALNARELEARLGPELGGEKARAVARLARLDGRRPPLGWLALRALRELGGRHEETLGIELALLNAIVWHGLGSARARLSGGSAGQE